MRPCLTVFSEPLKTEISLTFDLREDDFSGDQARALLALHLACELAVRQRLRARFIEVAPGHLPHLEQADGVVKVVAPHPVTLARMAAIANMRRVMEPPDAK